MRGRVPGRVGSRAFLVAVPVVVLVVLVVLVASPGVGAALGPGI